MPFLNEALQKGKDTKWDACWIHPDFIDRDGVHYFWFHKAFTSKSQIKTAHVDITADQKYKLFINQTFIGRGPLYGAPDYYSFDSYEVEQQLKAGENSIWILVMQDHPGDYYAGEHPAALLAQLKLTYADGTVETIGTGTDWRIVKDNGWHPHTPRSFYDLNNMEAVEMYDARAGFNPDSFDLCNDESVRAKTFNRNIWISEMYEDSPVRQWGKLWRYLQPREIPYMTEHPVDAKEIVTSGEVEPGNIDKHSYKPVPQMWQGLESIQPVQYAVVRDVENVINEDETFAVLQPGTQSDYPFRICYPAFILDFGEIMNGYIRLDVDAPAGCIIDIAYAHVLDNGKIYYKTGHHYRNKRYVCKEGRQQWESFEFVNTRYLQVTVRYQTPAVFSIQQFKPLKIYHVGLNRTEYPVKQFASFSSDQPLLDKLFKMSDNTALTCINDKLVDNNYREKNNWSGDVTTVMLPLIYQHGNLDIFKRYFRTFCYEQNPWGTFNIMVPEANDLIFDHSFSLVIRLEEYCTLTGDTALGKELYPHIRRYLEMAEKYENKDGVLEMVPWVVWFDWTNLTRKGIESTLSLMYLRVLMAAERIAGWADAEEDRAIIQQKIDTLRKSCVDYFWNESEGCFVEYVEDGKQSRSICEHANAVAILTGCCEDGRMERVIERVFSHGMELDRNLDIIKVAPIFQYYAMKALAAAGREDLLLEFFEKRSGLFVKRGLDTIPEVWDVDARTHDSFAQATPPESNMILSEIAGLKPYDAGFKEFIAEPRFDLVKVLNASMPSNAGQIGISWDYDGGEQCDVAVTVPTGAKCHFVAPKGWQVMDACSADVPDGEKIVYSVKKA